MTPNAPTGAMRLDDDDDDDDDDYWSKISQSTVCH